MDGFNIGKMAELNCVSVRTLRLYHEKGLLVPEKVNEENGRRSYTLDQCSQLDMILQLQSIGLSLDEIGGLAGQNDTSELEKALHRRLESIDDELRDLTLARQNAMELVRSCTIFNTTPTLDTPQIEYCRDRQTVEFPILNPQAVVLSEDGPGFIEQWELNLRMTKRRMIDEGYPMALFHNMGCIVARDDLVAGDLRLRASFVFVSNASARFFKNARQIPGGQFLVMYKDSYVTERGTCSEVEGLAALLAYARDNGLEIIGDYLGEIVADTPLFNFHGREMLYKLQIPVRRM